MMSGAATGFTLLGLLVAMAIFALLSVMAYSGLGAMVDTKEHVEREAERLSEVQRALAFLARDLQQAAGRPVRDEYGEALPAMAWELNGPSQLEFSRGGWRNPAGRPRSDLQRLSYELVETRLERCSWPVLDRAPRSECFRRVLLQEVEGFSVEFLDRAGQWQAQWPPEPAGDAAPATGRELPAALRFTLDLKDWGRIQRLVLVAR